MTALAPTDAKVDDYQSSGNSSYRGVTSAARCAEAAHR